MIDEELDAIERAADASKMRGELCGADTDTALALVAEVRRLRAMQEADDWYPSRWLL